MGKRIKIKVWSINVIVDKKPNAYIVQSVNKIKSVIKNVTFNITPGKYKRADHCYLIISHFDHTFIILHMFKPAYRQYNEFKANMKLHWQQKKWILISKLCIRYF